MVNVEFGKLADLPLRDVWQHEAIDFTPWLAENIDSLSDVIGVDLELTGTEVAVDTFSADILARNPVDDTVVLIENQLEATDHTHLGQIMTYLAGLDARTVIWIAPSFRPAHLSAIRWLNENTAEGFSFFAVKARVVQIGDSPFAPIFEAVEKPDGWSRALAEKKRIATGTHDPLSDLRLDFWTKYSAHSLDASKAGLKPQRGWNSYCTLADGEINISSWIGENNCGMYITGGRGDQRNSARALLSKHKDVLCDTLSASWRDNEANGHVLGERRALSYQNPENWEDIWAWMDERRAAYKAAIRQVLGEQAS